MATGKAAQGSKAPARKPAAAKKGTKMDALAARLESATEKAEPQAEVYQEKVAATVKKAAKRTSQLSVTSTDSDKRIVQQVQMATIPHLGKAPAVSSIYQAALLSFSKLTAEQQAKLLKGK